MIETYVATAVDGLAFGLLLFTVAAGLTLIYGVMGVLNLAHGSLYLAGAYLASGMVSGGLPTLALAVAAATLLGAGGGVLLDHLTRPLTGDQGQLSQALVTMGLALLAADACNTSSAQHPAPYHPRPSWADRSTWAPWATPSTGWRSSPSARSWPSACTGSCDTPPPA